MQTIACRLNMWRPPGRQVGEPVSEDLTLDEMRSHMAIWAIAKSPLMISADLRCCSLSTAGVPSL